MMEHAAHNNVDALELFDELVQRGADGLDSSLIFSHSEVRDREGFCEEDGEDCIDDAVDARPWGRFRAIRFLPRALQLRPDLVHCRALLNFDNATRNVCGTLLHWIVAHAGCWVIPCDDETKSETNLCLAVMGQLISLGVEVDARSSDAAGPESQSYAIYGARAGSPLRLQ
jgi:hypothetical protein